MFAYANIIIMVPIIIKIKPINISRFLSFGF